MGGHGIDSRESRTPQSAPASTASPARVVVLSGHGGRAPAALLGALGRHGLSARVVGDAPAVMTAVAEAGAATRAVIVCEPSRRAAVDPLREALAAYYPQVARWAYHAAVGAESARVTRLDESGSVPPEAEAGGSSKPIEPDHRSTSRGTAEAPGSAAASDEAPGGRFADLASVVEQATTDEAGPRLRLAVDEDEADHGDDRPRRVSPEERRRRAERARRRLADLSVTASPAVGRDTQATASTDDPDQPLVTREELAMLLGPPESAHDASPHAPAHDPPARSS